MNALKWSPSGQYFATGGSDRKLKLWEVHGGEVLFHLISLSENWQFSNNITATFVQSKLAFDRVQFCTQHVNILGQRP